MPNFLSLIWCVPLAPLVGCILCAILSFRGDKKDAHLPAILSLLISAASALIVLFSWDPDKADAGYMISEGYRYLQIGGVNLSLSLRVDTLCLTLLSVVTSISAMIAIYSKGYMHGDPGYARYFGESAADW